MCIEISSIDNLCKTVIDMPMGKIRHHQKTTTTESSMRGVIDTFSSSSFLLLFLLSSFLNSSSLRSPLFSHLYTITHVKGNFFFLKAYFPAIGEPPFTPSNISSTLCRRFSNGLQNLYRQLLQSLCTCLVL